MEMYYDIGGMYLLVSDEAKELVSKTASLDWKLEAPERGECEDYPDDIVEDLKIERKDLILELAAQLYWDNEEKAERYDLGLAGLAEELVKERLEDIAIAAKQSKLTKGVTSCTA